MTPALTSDQVFTLLATDTPKEKVVRVAVSTRDMTPEKLPAEGTPYKACEISDRPRVAQFGDYVLTGDADGPPGYIFLYFTKAKTEEEKWTPVKRLEDSMPWTWPEVLEGLLDVEDVNTPVPIKVPDDSDPTGVATVFVPRRLLVPFVTPETTASCSVVIEIFQANTPFTGLSYPQPNPGQVKWDFGASGGGQFTALHDDVTIRRMRNKLRVVANATESTLGGSLGQDLFFPATQFKDWRPFFVAPRGTFENGLYKLVRRQIFPPKKPKPVARR